MFTKLLKSSVSVATLAALTYGTPEVQAQTRDPVVPRIGDARSFYGPTFGPRYERSRRIYPAHVVAEPVGARVVVRVEDPNAEIWFNDSATRQRDTERVFATPALGRHGGTYEVRAIWTNAEGETMDQIQEITVEPGAEMFVDFTEPQ